MFASALSLLVLVQPGSAAIDGRWSNRKGSVVVAIVPCGAAMCGRVDWASEAAQADARKGGTDPLVGVEVLSDFVAKGPGRWKGRLFVPDRNTRAKAEIRQIGPDQLKVTGCAVAGLLCKSEIWTRATGP